MIIKQISNETFEEFANYHEYNNYHQSHNYALLKSEEGYEYEYIALYDEDEIKAAALVLYKKIQNQIYGYIPEGFLIDYNDFSILDVFSELLYKYYKKRNFVFIKINPRIIIGKVDIISKVINKTDNYKIVNMFEELGYTKLKDNMYFESLLPRFSAVIDLKKYDYYNVEKNIRNKYRKALRSGLMFEKANYNQIDIIDNFVNTKISDSSYHFKDYYSIFSKNDSVDAFLISINYQDYLNNAREFYLKEKKRNEHLNSLVGKYPTKKNINTKMNSDATLEAYHTDILNATKLNQLAPKYIGGAIVIKHGNTATLLVSGFDKEYASYMPNYFLFVNLLEYYKDKFDLFDLNGITGDMTKGSPYYGLNRFKIGFKPDVYEYIGEYDLIINNSMYNFLESHGYLADELNKEE